MGASQSKPSSSCKACATKPFSHTMMEAAQKIDERGELIYMDNNATTRPHRWVDRVMSTIADRFYGNPSASHVAGRAARYIVEEGRKHIAVHLNCKTSELTFTSGATEGNNIVLRSIRPEDHVVTSAIEHAATFETCKIINAKYGVNSVTIVPPIPGSRGLLSVDSVLRALRPHTKLVSLMYANNEIGTILPIQSIFQEIHATRPDILLHCDATQWLGKFPLDVHALGADFVTGSAHKFHGPKGIGLLYQRDRPEVAKFIRALCTGGVQEAGVRPGTENVAGIVGMATAMDCNLLKGHWQSTSDEMRRMRNVLWEKLQASVPSLQLNTPLEQSLPNTLSVSFGKVDSRSLMKTLAEVGVCINVGSACSKGKRSRVLEAIGVPVEFEQGTVRFSLSMYNTMKQVMRVVEVLKEQVTFQRANRKATSP